MLTEIKQIEESINVAMAVGVVEYNGMWYAVTSL